MNRSEFSAKVRSAALVRSGGFCECHILAKAGIHGFYVHGCGAQISPGNVNFEHVIPDGMGGDNSLKNCAALCRTCWRLKTSRYDAPKLAKVRHQHRANWGIKEKHGPSVPGSRNTPFKKTFHHGTQRR